jgi:hypothetical protein
MTRFFVRAIRVKNKTYLFYLAVDVFFINSALQNQDCIVRNELSHLMKCQSGGLRDNIVSADGGRTTGGRKL